MRSFRLGSCLAAATEAAKAAAGGLRIVLVSKAELKPVLISQFNVIAFELCLIRSFIGELEGFKRAGFHAGLFTSGAAFLVPIGRIKAEIAFGGLADEVVPGRPMIRLLRTHSKAGFAADAFIAVDPPDIAVFCIYICSSDGAIRNAGRIHTLETRRHLDIVGKSSKGVLADLNARKRQVLLSIVYERTGEHAGRTARAFSAVVNNISC